MLGYWIAVAGAILGGIVGIVVATYVLLPLGGIGLILGLLAVPVGAGMGFWYGAKLGRQ